MPLESGHLDDTGMDAVPIDTSRAAALEHFNDCPDCFGDQLCAIVGQRSSHNSINDKLDMVRWQDLNERLEALLARPEYESLMLDKIGPSLD